MDLAVADVKVQRVLGMGRHKERRQMKERGRETTKEILFRRKNYYEAQFFVKERWTSEHH